MECNQPGTQSVAQSAALPYRKHCTENLESPRSTSRLSMHISSTDDTVLVRHRCPKKHWGNSSAQLATYSGCLICVVSIRPVRGDELVCSQLPFRMFGEAVARLHGRRALKGGVQAWNIPGSANLGCPIWIPRLCWLQGFPDPFQTFEDVF